MNDGGVETGDSHVPLPEDAALEQARERLLDTLLLKRSVIAAGIVRSVAETSPDYGKLRAKTLAEDVGEAAFNTVTVLLRGLRQRDRQDGELEDVRRSAARRVHQEVSLPSLLQSYRIWGRELWEAVLREAGNSPVMRDAALGLVGDILDYVDRVSVLVAQVYLEEAAGAYRARDVLRSDVLESLLIGRPLSDQARKEVTRLNLDAGSQIAIVLTRLNNVMPEHLRAQSLRVLQAYRESLADVSEFVLGVRDSDVICLIRIQEGDHLKVVIDALNQIAARQPGWRICMGRPYAGLPGVPRSFQEAQEASVVAGSQDRSGRATFFSEIVLDRILVNSEYGDTLMEEYIKPLLEYDRDHAAQLVATLRAYVACDLNLSRTAKGMLVSPNTVAYRVKRIGDLTGQDPTTSSGILTLALALRLLDG